MKKMLLISTLSLIALAFVIFFLEDNILSSTHKTVQGDKSNKKLANDQLKTSKKILAENEEIRLLSLFERGGSSEFKLPAKSLNIKEDLKNMKPCEFLAKYQDYDNQEDLWFSLIDEYGDDKGQSFFYTTRQNFDHMDQSFNDLEGEMIFELINHDIYDYFKFPSSVGIKENNPIYPKMYDITVAKLTALIEKYYGKFDEAFYDLESNPIYAILLTYNINSEYKYIDKKIPEDQFEKRKEEYIYMKADQIRMYKESAIKDKAKAIMYEYFEEYNNSTSIKNLIPIQMRNDFLSQASSPTEMALAYNMYERTKRVNYKNIIKVDKYLRGYNKTLHTNFRKYLKDYVTQIIDTKDASFVNKELYQILSIYDHRLKNESYEDFLIGKKNLLDPIYGAGCDDRRYKDICTIFCRNNN